MVTEGKFADINSRAKLASITPRAYLGDGSTDPTSEGYLESDSTDFPAPAKVWIKTTGDIKIDSAEGGTVTLTIEDSNELNRYLRDGLEVKRIYSTGTTCTYEIWK